MCDNAALHTKGYNTNLSDWLWDVEGIDGRPLRILLLPLPTRSPELNPIELLWNTLVQRLRGYEKPDDGSHRVARMAHEVLDGFDFDLALRTFRHCGLNV